MPNDCTERRLPWRMGGASYAAEGVELHSSSTCHRLDRVERTCRWRDPGSRAASSPCPHLLATPSTCHAATSERYSTAPTRMDGCLHALACIRMPQHCAATLNGLRPVGGRWRARARARTHARTHTRRRRGGGARERASGEHKVALVRKARPKAMAYPAESLEPLALQQVACLRPFVLFRRRVRSHRFDLVERTSEQTNKQTGALRRHGAAGFARLGSNICKRNPKSRRRCGRFQSQCARSRHRRRPWGRRVCAVGSEGITCVKTTAVLRDHGTSIGHNVRGR